MSGHPRRRDLRLLPVAGITWAAAFVATRYPGLAASGSAALWAVALALVAVLFGAGRHRRIGRFASVLTVAAVAAAFAAATVSHVAVAHPERDRAARMPISGGRSVVLEAAVTGKVERSPTGWRFDAVTTRIDAAAESLRASIPVVVRAAERPAALDLGATIRVTGSAFPAEPGERAVLVVDAATPPQLRAPPSGVLAATAGLRSALVAQSHTLPRPGAGLIAGLAVGETSAVTDELDAQMKTASLSHLTAVSGANCALVVGIAFVTAAWLGLRRGWRVAAGLVVLVGFVLLVSPEPSVVRAAAMAAIAMLAVLLGRAGAGVSVLSLAIIACIIADPWLAGSLGFALSAAATGALLLAAGPVGDTLARFMPRPLALAVAVPLAAQLACTPLIVLIDPRLPVYAVLANVLTAPAAPLATVAGLAACLFVGVPVLASGFAALAWLPCAWIAATAGLVSVLPGNAVPWIPDLAGAAVALALSAAVLVVLIPRAPRLLARFAVGVLALTVGVGSGVIALTGPIQRAAVPDDWAVAICDVGQGDAVLLRSAERTALVDTGPEPERLAACLDLFGVDWLDLLVLTHFDLDHSGGVAAIRGRVGLVLHGPLGEPADEALLNDLVDAGAATQAVSSGMSGVLGDARWRVLWPRSSGVVFPPGNDASVVLTIEGGGIPRSILLGDLSETPQVALSPAVRGSFDIVKVAHHGSADQAAALYRRIGARIALIGVGENDYGHPRSEILDVLATTGTSVARTDRTGAAAVLATERGLELWRQRPG
ncbi:ComEC/Rec2 family competence protein [Microbacterium imperiale]|uniref:Competence protein ComEC n=1 Tax=Microbacterium imperiale TaxID=33884 RepID=A0A9W6M2Q4_9MICO|nr:ComEC/Rec2 family competence protein [Microbacterium imperiale]MBP2419453.1 competence protein ComEC [Microbacterium imperiale]MDS0198677.1 ComEC/Rec2 family competence protein [Microbacterium imperiale]BFE39795.1 ComEC/Rec2 family competence protein [Microbacterium imperiale]GLJ79230.1 competence protein ComEC [Microbacterium imperiale]